MIRAVPDTNVRFSANLTFGGTAWKCLSLLRLSHQILVSEALLAEYEQLLLRKTSLRPEAIHARLAYERSTAHIVSITRRIANVCRDPDDDRVLECAVSGAAHLIVSGDKDLLVLGQYEGIAITTPAEALRRLQVEMYPPANP